MKPSLRQSATKRRGWLNGFGWGAVAITVGPWLNIPLIPVL